MLRIKDTEFDAHGYISTDGIMNVSFKTDKSLEEIKELLTKSENIEMFERYVIEKIQSAEYKDGAISLQMKVGAMGKEPEKAKAPVLNLETMEDYAAAVESKAILLSDVPADIRDNVAIKLGV